jgi:60 kDa SS-A/Ro ribonucleoprotein
MRYSQHLAAPTPQSEPARPEQVKNSAGGYSFKLDGWKRLRRFLISGAEGGTYYATERKLTKENATSIIELIKQDGKRVVGEIVAVSTLGLAHKNDPAIFALALACAHGDAETKKHAYVTIPTVCRTGTHLFHLCQAIQDLRGWSRGLRNGVAKWYTDRSIDQLEYQLVKYRQRDGWTHRDVMRLAHPHFGTAGGNELAAWAVGKAETAPNFPRVEAMRALQRNSNFVLLKEGQNTLGDLITEARLPWEAVPTEMLNNPAVLDALFDQMPLGALVRNLNRFTKAGVIAPLSDRCKDAVARLTDREEIKKARLHPIQILNALLAYSGQRRSLVKNDGSSIDYSPVAPIMAALNDAFYLSFETIEPAGVPTVVALDISGSMGDMIGPHINLSCREASAALAMATVRTEPNVAVIGFSHRPIELSIHARMSLEEVIREISRHPFGSTDCSLPMLWARERGIKGVGNFAVYTDGETWAGDMHPFEALKKYRDWSGNAARSAVVGMTSTGFSLADPSDAGMLDVAGFSTDTPAMLASFARGEL